MKKSIISIVVVLLMTNVFAQRNTIPKGDWEFIEYAGSNDLNFEDFSDCFWCQLGENKTINFKENTLIAKLNEESIVYNYEVKNNQLILSKTQIVQITTEKKGTETQTTTGQIIFDLKRKRRKLFLMEENSLNKRIYTFLKSK